MEGQQSYYDFCFNSDGGRTFLGHSNTESKAPDDPPPNSGPLVQTGLMIFSMVLRWSLNRRTYSVYLSMIGEFLIAVKFSLRSAGGGCGFGSLERRLNQ